MFCSAGLALGKDCRMFQQPKLIDGVRIAMVGELLHSLPYLRIVLAT